MTPSDLTTEETTQLFEAARGSGSELCRYVETLLADRTERALREVEQQMGRYSSRARHPLWPRTAVDRARVILTRGAA